MLKAILLGVVTAILLVGPVSAQSEERLWMMHHFSTLNERCNRNPVRPDMEACKARDLAWKKLEELREKEDNSWVRVR